MTRKDFELIANVLSVAQVSPNVRTHLTVLFANRLAGSNPAFDRARFIRACEGRAR